MFPSCRPMSLARYLEVGQGHWIPSTLFPTPVCHHLLHLYHLTRLAISVFMKLFKDVPDSHTHKKRKLESQRSLSREASRFGASSLVALGMGGWRKGSRDKKQEADGEAHTLRVRQQRGLQSWSEERWKVWVQKQEKNLADEWQLGKVKGRSNYLSMWWYHQDRREKWRIRINKKEDALGVGNKSPWCVGLSSEIEFSTKIWPPLHPRQTRNILKVSEHTASCHTRDGLLPGSKRKLPGVLPKSYNT